MWTLVVIIVIIFIYSILKNIFNPKKKIEPIISKYPKRLTEEEYGEILTKYKKSIASEKDSKLLEKKANDFESKFYLRALSICSRKYPTLVSA